MASTQTGQTGAVANSAQQTRGARSMPTEPPPIANPPMVAPYVDDEDGDGPFEAAEAAAASTPDLEAEVAAQFGSEARSARFSRPVEPDYSLAPAEHLEIRNSNVPLTLGLLFSVIAAFMVFFVSLVGGTASAADPLSDPIIVSFWRSLAALAVFTTLSFVASWFMPAPSERRLQLQKLGQEQEADPFGDFDYNTEEQEPEATAAPMDEDRGSSVDVTLTDQMEEYEEDSDEDDLDEQYQTDVFGTQANSGAAQTAAPGPGR